MWPGYTWYKHDCVRNMYISQMIVILNEFMLWCELTSSPWALASVFGMSIIRLSSPAPLPEIKVLYHISKDVMYLYQWYCLQFWTYRRWAGVGRWWSSGLCPPQMSGWQFELAWIERDLWVDFVEKLLNLLVCFSYHSKFAGLSEKLLYLFALPFFKYLQWR